MPDQRAVPAVAVFDVNETLSDLDGLVSRLKEAGGDRIRPITSCFPAAATSMRWSEPF